MWDDLNTEWKKCFSLAWQSYCHCNNPIGAIITNTKGNIISMNRNGGKTIFPKRMSHAEINAISNLNSDVDMENLTLYSTLEPCVMCFSTIYVQKIKKIRFGCIDPHAGGTFLYKSSSYFSLREIDIKQYDNIEFRFVNALINIVYEMNNMKSKDLLVYLDEWEKIFPSLTKIANVIFQDNRLKSYSIESDVKLVYNYIALIVKQYLL